MTTDDFAVLFDDGKEPGALRTIGEVAKALGIRQHVLRYWEEQFSELRPVKRSGGRRYYRPEDIRLVATIDRLVHREGYTLKGAKKVVTDGRGEGAVPGLAARPAAAAPVRAMAAALVPNAETLTRLRAIRARLAAALEQS